MKKQKAFCMICGKPFMSNYDRMKNGSLCSKECLQEWNWRYTLFVMGSNYSIDPKKLISEETAK